MSSTNPSPTGSSVNMNIEFETSGSSPAQTSPFQQSQPFGFSTSFGLSSQSVFGTTVSVTITSTQAFGATSTRDVGSTSTSPFGLTARPSFGTSASACGSSSTPSFSFPSIPAVGQSSSTSSNPAFGVSISTPSFSFPSTPAFAQSTSTVTSSHFGALSPQSSPFDQSTTPIFGNTAFRHSDFGAHVEQEASRLFSSTVSTETVEKLESISGMQDKSHEELRWEDYQLGNDGGRDFGQFSATSNQISFSQPAPFFSSPFQPCQPIQTSPSVFSSFDQTQPGNITGLDGSLGSLCQNNSGQQSATQSSAAVQPIPATDLLGTLPPRSPFSVGCCSPEPSWEDGIFISRALPVRRRFVRCKKI